MKTSKAAVVIPIYKEELSGYEKVSLVQCCKILGRHPFVLACPEDLDAGAYEEILKRHGVGYEIERFFSEHFSSVRKYSELLLGSSFYQRFIKYEYLLLYQLDAYVFRDELEYWCDQGYDYIGAPWFEEFGLCASGSKMLDVAGNGGFSLRKTVSFINILDVSDIDGREAIKQFIDSRQNEDVFFARLGSRIAKDFKVAPPEVAIYFSFECLPEKLYEMTGKKIPFGCHAWERYSLDFWKDFIHLESRDFEKEFRLAKADLDAAKARLSAVLADRDEVEKEMDLALKLALDERDRVVAEQERIYRSREWKVALFLRKYLSAFFPKSSLHRKILAKLWEAAKALLGLFLRAMTAATGVWFLCANRARGLILRKRRKINTASKKIVYVGHSYHSKTKSTVFLIDYLKELYDVEIVLDESWRGAEQQYPDLSFVDSSYLGVVFFQSLPKKSALKRIKNDNLIFFPMYDGVRHDYGFWSRYYDLKICNFSRTLHEKLSGWGLDSMYVQYFPKPQEFFAGNKDEIFFWQRINKISFNILKKILRQEDLRVHIHKAVDPSHQFIQPSAEDEKKFGITYSDWFDTREEMWDVIKQKGIYVAPREFEGIGMSFLEAMAMGKAVIAANNPTMNEYIEHGKTGYLFDLKKPQAIDLSKIKEVQKKTYEHMQKGFAGWERNKRSIIDFIEKP